MNKNKSPEGKGILYYNNCNKYSGELKAVTTLVNGNKTQWMEKVKKSVKMEKPSLEIMKITQELEKVLYHIKMAFFLN